jgi:hypothetical protein
MPGNLTTRELLEILKNKDPESKILLIETEPTLLIHMELPYSNSEQKVEI